MSQTWYLKRRTIILLHIVAWLLFLSGPLLLRPLVGFDRHPSGSHHVFPAIFSAPPRFEILQLISNILLIGVFYLNAYILLPGVIKNRKFFRSLFFQLLLFVGFCLINYGLFSLIIGYVPRRLPIEFHNSLNQFLPPSQQIEPPWIGHRGNTVFHPFLPVLFKNTLFYFLIIVSAIAYCMTIDRIRLDRLAKEKETENLKTELQLLRSQINPHFLFNVLNNMVSLARKKSDTLEDSLIKLSSLMRYMYYDSGKDKVPLYKEVSYIKSYIEIQQQRFQGNLNVETHFLINEDNYYIEPMLLIPFVENAFKHGITLVEDANIQIDLSVTNGILYFKVNNKFSTDKDEIKDKTSGIGLKNVKKRLDLLYSDHYHLDIKSEDNWHTVSLQLNLK